MEKIIAIDFETAKNPYPCQIGITIIEKGEIVNTFMRYIKPPKNEYNPHCIEVHGITPDVTEHAPEFPEVWNEISHLFKDCIIIAHNASFDMKVLHSSLEYYGIDFDFGNSDYLDTCALVGKKKLNEACAEYGIPFSNHHNAFFDSLACAQLFLALYIKTALEQEDNLTKKEHTQKKEIPVYHEAITGDLLKKDLTNANPGNPFYDKKVVITGVFSIDRKDIAIKLKKLGADVDTSITKRTAYVCVGKDPGLKKLESIQKYNDCGCNIVMLSECELISILDKWSE